MDFSPKGERASESIEVHVIAFPQVSYSDEITEHVPGGNRTHI
jgi:hypothetical protein